MSILRILTVTVTAVVMMAALAWTPLQVVAAPNFQIRELAAVETADSRAFAISARGHVGGNTGNILGVAQATVWTTPNNGTIIDTGSENDYSVVNGLNRSDTAVGFRFESDGAWAYKWENGQSIKLPSLGTHEHYNEYAAAVNDSGQVVGYSKPTGSTERATTWINNLPVNLTPDPETITSAATAINNNGVIVGSRNARAVKWTNGVMADLNLPLPANFPAGATPSGDARSINEQGEIAGYMAWSSDSAAGYYAYVWINGVTTFLPPINATYTQCIAYGINKNTEIVGECQDDQGGVRAVYWHNGVVVDLGVLPDGTHSSAQAINDKGYIVGYSNNAAGIYRAVRWH